MRVNRAWWAMVRDWWPVPAFLVPIVVVQAVWTGGYDVEGHAAGHLSSATAVFPMAFMAATLLWALPADGRRDPALWLLLAAALAGTVVVLAGNLRVVDALAGDQWSDGDAGRLEATGPGLESGHDLAAQGAYLAVAATMLLAGLLWRRRLASPRAAAGAAFLSLLVPPWIAPGFGIVVLVVAAGAARARRLSRARSSAGPATPAPAGATTR